MPISMGFLTVHDGEGRCNQVLYRQCMHHQPKGLVVFFPGDISDFAYSRMNDPLVCGDDCAYNFDYSLETLAFRVSSAVPDCYALAIFKPNLMLGNYSIFSNFFISDTVGNPRWQAMDSTVRTASVSLSSFLSDLKMLHDPSLRLDSLIIAGFSKGCTVVSTLLRECDGELIAKVSRWVYIDPGASIPGSTFPESASHEPSAKERVSVYSSPFQMDDYNRPWVRTETERFVDATGCQFTAILSDQPRSLDNHFNSITVALGFEFNS